MSLEPGNLSVKQAAGDILLELREEGSLLNPRWIDVFSAFKVASATQPQIGCRTLCCLHADNITNNQRPQAAWCQGIN